MVGGRIVYADGPYAALEKNRAEFLLCQYQSTVRKPATRENSLALRVTSVASCARAIPAMRKSTGPSGVPAFSSLARKLAL